jgi:hypothetical protein
VKVQPPKVGQVVDPGADLVGQRAVFKIEFQPLLGGGRLMSFPNLQLNLWTERIKYYSQASHLERPHQSLACMPIPGMDT